MEEETKIFTLMDSPTSGMLQILRRVGCRNVAFPFHSVVFFFISMSEMDISDDFTVSGLLGRICHNPSNLTPKLSRVLLEEKKK
ncbi:hypothetical protein GDO78_002497 [Eleutherodactylus coqui]|uniref:Uncharacterized protein n=1 Tax=Eleutherodactylus coqui TaxID=57060 RepID=A0A8J6K140_ELECQ|nr:hypothetical protein GDO78_002497 [Eleutherodactylus coqui]